MIPKRIDRKGKSDNYRALALYAADAKAGHSQGEKIFHHWYAGGEAENYLEGLIEVEATQAMNRRAKGEKTYHLMVSFHPEDEAVLTPQVLEEIESMLADALGLSGHQRHCGVHANTNNMHLHVAYNLINPLTYKKRFPYYDYPKLHKACRAIEQKFGLVVDKGMEADSPAKDSRPNAKVRTIEAQTGQESFFGYVLKHKAVIMGGLEQAAAWPDIHLVFLKHGLILKLAGNGMAIKDRHGEHSVKASTLDRSVSKKSLEDKFGPFEALAPDLQDSIQSAARYTAAPLCLGEDRGDLYAAFQQEMAERKSRLETIRRENEVKYRSIKDKWKQKREVIKLIPMLRSDRRRVMEQVKKNERTDFDQLRQDMAKKREELRQDIPYTSWAKCLQHKAALGSGVALTLLRSRRNPSASTATRPDYSPGQSSQLPEVTQMQEIIKREYGSRDKAGKLKYAVDAKGTLIFSLPGGGSIRDNGEKIHRSPHGAAIEELHKRYASMRGQQAKNRQDEPTIEYGIGFDDPPSGSGSQNQAQGVGQGR